MAKEALEEGLRALFPGGASDRKGFSTRLVYQPYIATLDDLHLQAERVQPAFRGAIHALATPRRPPAVRCCHR